MNYRVLHLADLERFLELRMEFLLSYQDVPKDFQNITENYLRKHMETEDLLLLAAEEEGSLVAACMVCFYETYGGQPLRQIWRIAQCLHKASLPQERHFRKAGVYGTGKSQRERCDQNASALHRRWPAFVSETWFCTRRKIYGKRFMIHFLL